MSIDHLDTKILNKTTQRLWAVQGSLQGLSGLFTLGARDIHLEGDQFFGIGQLLEKIGEEVGILRDILTSGQDSMADVRNGMDKDEEDDSPEVVEKHSGPEIEQFSKQLLSIIEKFSTKKIE